MFEQEDEDYRKLLMVVRETPDVPEGLKFWIEHAPTARGAVVWADCPRGDWLLWLAVQLGGEPIWINSVRAGMEELIEKSRGGGLYSPHILAAHFVRDRIQWQRLQRMAA